MHRLVACVPVMELLMVGTEVMKYFVHKISKATLQLPDVKRHGQSIKFRLSQCNEVDWSQYLHQVKTNNPSENDYEYGDLARFIHRKYIAVDNSLPKVYPI